FIVMTKKENKKMTAKTVTIDVEQLEKLLERHSDAIIEYTGGLSEETINQFDLLLTEIIELDSKE
ncbi:hypothetical protein SJ950_14185, partial [Enterococcus faecium]